MLLASHDHILPTLSQMVPHVEKVILHLIPMVFTYQSHGAIDDTVSKYA